MIRHALAVLAYVIATFATQAASHFAINSAHYAAVSFMRAEPIFAMGVLSTLAQGTVLSIAFERFTAGAARLIDALAFAWLAGVFLVSYPALAEPAKYAVPSVGAWLTVELGAGFVQFTLYGLLLYLIHRKTAVQTAPQRL